MRRAICAVAALLLLCGTGRHAGVGPTGFSPDGTFIINGIGSLNTVYGAVTFGPVFAPTPHWGGGPLYVFELNGRPMGPAQVFGGWQLVYVDYGGNLFALTLDELWYSWQGHAWQGNSGGDHTTPPGTLGPPQALPTAFSGPYIPSADGTATTSAGGGGLTTADGMWTYGTVNGGGKNLVLNGQEVWVNNSQSVAPATVGTPFPVTDMQVNSHGNLFFKTTDTNWHVWAGNQENASAGPTALPIPVNITFDATLVTMPAGSTIGTHIVGLVVTMSDGGSFSGTGAVSLDYQTGLQMANYDSGTNSLVSAWTPPGPAGGHIQMVTLTQNGSSMSVVFDFGI